MKKMEEGTSATDTETKIIKNKTGLNHTNFPDGFIKEFCQVFKEELTLIPENRRGRSTSIS